MADDLTSALALATELLVTGGHTTSGTVDAIESTAGAYGMDLAVVPEWSHTLFVDAQRRPVRVIHASPVGVNMGVVTAVLRTLESARGTLPEPAVLRDQLTQDGRHRPYPDWLFALAAVTGACALAVIFGATRPMAFVFIVLAAGIGGFARRWLGAHGIKMTGQAFAAAAIAGAFGSLSVAMDDTSPARLVAVCPAMVLVPGPHLLNGALDIASLRIALGFNRLLYGALIVLGICGGLILGLIPGGTLPLTAVTHSPVLPLDMLAAAVAAASYPIYFSLDARLIIWPVIVGALAHAARWFAMSVLSVDNAAGAFVACLIAGALLAPVARTRHASFAGVGFAAVVALVPGVFVFRAMTGVVELMSAHPASTVDAVASDLSVAVLTLVAMALGLVVGRASVIRAVIARKGERHHV